MSLPVLIQDEAEKDLDKIIAYYYEAGAGYEVIEFLKKKLLEMIDFIELFPEFRNIREKDIRIAQLADFPLLVAYRIRTNHVSIIAISHSARQDLIWKNR